MAALHCLSCEHANSTAAKFCAQCGSALNLRLCGKCEAINERNALRCHSCDAPLAVARAARRPRVLIALASAALVGLVGAAGAFYLVDRMRLEAAQVRATPQTEKGSGPFSEKRVLTPFPLTPAPAERTEAAARTVTHTRAAPARAVIAPAPAALPAAALPVAPLEDAAPPVTHTRRAVATPETKTGSH